MGEIIKNTNILSNLQILQISFTHIGVGIAIITLSSFLNSEMTFAGWKESQISIYLGSAIIFELTRLYIGYLYDKNKTIIRLFVVGMLLSSGGIFFAQYFITPIGNYQIILSVALFYAGSSMLTTLVDSYLTEITESSQRSKIAGIIQISRLSGFALGGFIGSLLYVNIEFSILILLVTIVMFLTSIISLTGIRYESILINEEKELESFSESLIKLKTIVFSPLAGSMTVFLLLYTIGLFMQDLVLEPFAINNLGFGKENVGKVVAIWTSLTLVFVPIGVYFSDNFNRIITIIGGETLAFIGLTSFAIAGMNSSTIIFYFGLILFGIGNGIGLTSFAIAGMNSSTIIFYFGLVLFGIGNGIASAPAISMMLDVCAINKENLSLLLGFFGIVTTIGRFSAALIGGLILDISNQNFLVLFFTEGIIVILSIPPIYLLHQLMQSHDKPPTLTHSDIKIKSGLNLGDV